MFLVEFSVSRRALVARPLGPQAGRGRARGRG